MSTGKQNGKNKLNGSQSISIRKIITVKSIKIIINTKNGTQIYSMPNNRNYADSIWLQQINYEQKKNNCVNADSAFTQITFLSLVKKKTSRFWIRRWRAERKKHPVKEIIKWASGWFNPGQSLHHLLHPNPHIYRYSKSLFYSNTFNWNTVYGCTAGLRWLEKCKIIK